MSMNVGGGGGVRPLSPPVQQPQGQDPKVQQPGVGSNQQAPQSRPGQAGRHLHNINNFNSQPVSNDFQQAQAWLNRVNGGSPTPQQPAPQQSRFLQPQQTFQQQPTSNLQQAQENGRNNAIARAEERAAAKAAAEKAAAEKAAAERAAAEKAAAERAAAERVAAEKAAAEAAAAAEKAAAEAAAEAAANKPLDADQKKILSTGLDRLGAVLDIDKSDMARLAHAKASGNDALFYYHTGKLDIPPGSAKAQQLQKGLDALIEASGGAYKAIAKEIQPTIILDDITRLASNKAIDLPPTLVIDLGALTNNEMDRFMALAQATGVPKDKAEKMLQGYKAIGQQFDISAAELDSILGKASRAVNTSISVAMNKVADKLNLSPELFNDLSNAVLRKDPKAFAAIGEKAGLSKSEIREVLPKITQALSAINKSSDVINGEKLQRFTKDTSLQNQITSAGKEFGLKPEQSLELAAAFTEMDLLGFVNVAQEYGLGRNASQFLNKLEDITKREGRDALTLATNNLEGVSEQRKLAQELGLQNNPVQWSTPSSSPYQPTQTSAQVKAAEAEATAKAEAAARAEAAAQAEAAAKAEAALKAKNEVRYVKLADDLRNVEGQIHKLERIMNNSLFRAKYPQGTAELNKLRNQEKNIRAELREIRNLGHTPTLDRAKEIKLLDQLEYHQNQLKEMEGYRKKFGRIGELTYAKKIQETKARIGHIQNELDKLRGQDKSRLKISPSPSILRERESIFKKGTF